MCLIKKHIFPKFSFRDKIVYKVLDKSHNDFYCTPIIGYEVKLGETIKANGHLLKAIISAVIKNAGVHAFCNKSSCCSSYYFSSTRERVLVKCIIPRFTLYWNGKDGEIASRKLIIKEII